MFKSNTIYTRLLFYIQIVCLRVIKSIFMYELNFICVFKRNKIISVYNGGILVKGSDDIESAVCYTIYTIYLSQLIRYDTKIFSPVCILYVDCVFRRKIALVDISSKIPSR